MDGEVIAMDREECPILIETNVAAATCLPEADDAEPCITAADETATCVALLEPALNDACEPISFSTPADAAGPQYAPAPPPALHVDTGAPPVGPSAAAGMTQPAGAAELDLPRAAAPEPAPARIVEACLFSADTPLSAARLGEVAGLSAKQLRLIIAELNDQYAAAGLSFRIEEIARGYQMMTQPGFQPWLAKLNKQQAQTRLSPAALETLSIVAYKQPVIRADIEAIRGVSTGEVLNRLREMGLVKVVGRAEIVGRPLMYGTAKKFLDVFGLADLTDLPPMESLALRKPATPLGAGRGSLAEALRNPEPASSANAQAGPPAPDYAVGEPAERFASAAAPDDVTARPPAPEAAA